MCTLVWSGSITSLSLGEFTMLYATLGISASQNKRELLAYLDIWKSHSTFPVGPVPYNILAPWRKTGIGLFPMAFSYADVSVNLHTSQS